MVTVFPDGTSGEESTSQCRRWKRTWVRSLGWEDSLEMGMAMTPVFLPGESHRQRSMVGYNPMGSQTVRHNWNNSVCPHNGYTTVQFSHSVVSDSLQPHGLQHTRPPCPSLTPGVYSNSCSLSRWCHPTISSSVIPFSSRPQYLPASGSFPMSQFFASGGQSIGVWLYIFIIILPCNKPS